MPPRPTPAPERDEEKRQPASPGVRRRALNGSLKANRPRRGHVSAALTILPNPESSSTSGRCGPRSPPVHSRGFPVWPYQQLPVDINNALALSLHLKNADGFQLQGNILAHNLLFFFF